MTCVTPPTCFSRRLTRWSEFLAYNPTKSKFEANYYVIFGGIIFSAFIIFLACITLLASYYNKRNIFFASPLGYLVKYFFESTLAIRAFILFWYNLFFAQSEQIVSIVACSNSTGCSNGLRGPTSLRGSRWTSGRKTIIKTKWLTSYEWGCPLDIGPKDDHEVPN